jgi:hypothetical protein
VAYYIRTLTQSDQRIPFVDLRLAVAKDHPKATLWLRKGTEADWETLCLRHPNGTDIALIERNAVSDEVGREELQEFRHEIADCVPASAATWLDHFLSRVRVIHAFQVLPGTREKSGWDILGTLKNALWSRTGGIIQADREGFTNEHGFHILWQFSDSVSGPWWMGVLEGGRWAHFQMDLGNADHRKAFMAGAVPEGVRRA